MNPLSLLEKAINEHGSATILKERLLLVREMLDKVEREKSEIEKELNLAKKEIESLKAQIPGKSFVEYMGAKFKRKPSGSFESSVYCPICECGMSSLSHSGSPFICAKCHATTTFSKGQLNQVLGELKHEFP